MAENSGNEFSFLKGLLIGSALGVIGGILLAPKSGKELRADIVERGKSAFDTVKGKAFSVKEAFRAGRDAAREEYAKGKGESEETL